MTKLSLRHTDDEMTKLIDDRLAKQFPDMLSRNFWPDTLYFDNIHNAWGLLKSTKGYSSEFKLQSYLYWQYREKSAIALAAASSWYGGDYVEFGSHDLYTLRNFLSAYDLSGLDKAWPDTRFYGFDIFGKIASDNPMTLRSIEHLRRYFDHFTERGDLYAEHVRKLQEHDLYLDRYSLIQGFFQDTVPPFKENYKKDGRKIGFALLDVNTTESYELTFGYIFDLMAERSYIYMDEYFQNYAVITLFEDFRKRLLQERNMDCTYVRSCAALGALFLLHPVWDRSRPGLASG